jgi:hypothetical protein
LAEASAIYVASAVIGTLSAINYQGLGINGGADGNEGSVQFKSNNGFAGQEGFTYNDDTFTLNVINVNITNTLSSINLRSSVVSSTNSSAVNLYATTISATTVCATNYNAALEALSFQNLDNRYLNAAGDSVTGSFYLQNLSSITISATSYRNLPSALATWNASAIQGIPVTSTPPSLGESLVFKDGYWQPSAVGGGVGGTPGDPALSIQFKNGSFFSGVESIKYNSSINGIQSVTISSTNLSSTNLSSTTLRSVGVCATNISATTYQNLQEDTAKWNANKIYGTPFSKGSLVLDDFITYDGATAWKNTAKAEVANILYPLIQPQIPSGLATWNASAIQGITVTATAPSFNNVLIYNGSVWTPSASISLGTIAATNLGGTNIVGTNASINNVSSTGLSALAVSATNISAVNIWPGSVNATNVTGSNLRSISASSTTLSAIDARIVGLSATTLSATRYLGLPSGEATWNASAIKGANVATVDAAITNANPIGTLIYNKNTNEYFTLPFSSTVLTGSRNLLVSPYQGQVVASYLGSASEYFQINPAWNTPALSIYDIPSNKDVLVFSSNLYNLGGGGAWTWEQPSALYRTSAAGSTGYVQFAGAGGAFSGDSNLIYYPEVGRLDLSTIWAYGQMYYPGNGANSTYISKTGINAQFLQVYNSLNSPDIRGNYVSAIVYNLFTKDTSSINSNTQAAAPTSHNQTITFDVTGNAWRPGYTIYQATGIPNNSQGVNGDIYFRYIP